MLEGTTTIRKIDKSLMVRLPIYVAKDSKLPFELGDKVTVRIENNKVIIEKVKT